MYIPDYFRLEDRTEITAIMEANSFALITSHDEGGGLIASHLPFMYDPGRGEFGTLIAHMARANPQWRGFVADEAVLVVFQGPHAYISPNDFDRANAVPTWNYAAVHAYGAPQIVTDDGDVRNILNQLIEVNEAAYTEPWTYQGSDEVLKKMRGAIVAFEIPINRIDAKLKLGQHRPGELSAVVEGLRRRDSDDTRALADLTEKLSP